MDKLIYFAMLTIAAVIPVLIFIPQKQTVNIAFLDKHHTGIIKGIAILCVVFCHSMNLFGQGLTWFTPLGGIGVSIFLLVSGYGLSLSWESNGGKGYIRKRLIAVFIPYAIFESLTYWTTVPFHIKDYLLDMVCWRPLYAHGWYLRYLLEWYFLFFIIMKIGILRKYKLQIAFLIGVYTFFRLPELHAEQSLSFFMGMFLAEKRACAAVKKCQNCLLGFALLIIGMAALAVKQIDAVRSCPELCMKAIQLMIKLPIGLSLIILSYWCCQRINLHGLSIIGTISYELYLVHGAVLPKVPLTVTGEMAFIVISVLGSILLWYICTLNGKLLKKVFRLTR